MRGIPYSARESEVSEFLKTTKITNDDIVLLYDSDGRFSGEAHAKFNNKEDFKTALSLHLSNIGTRYIEVFEINDKEFSKAKSSKASQKGRPNQTTNPSWNHLLGGNLGILRMRGLPYSSTDEGNSYVLLRLPGS